MKEPKNNLGEKQIFGYTLKKYSYETVPNKVHNTLS